MRVEDEDDGDGSDREVTKMDDLVFGSTLYLSLGCPSVSLTLVDGFNSLMIGI